MKRDLIAIFLLIAKITSCVENNYTYYSQQPTAHYQIKNNSENDRVSNIVNNVLSKIVPAVPSLVALGKLIANKIKERKDNKQNDIDNKKLAAMKQTLQKQQKQLQNLTVLYAHYCCQELSPCYKKRLKQRSSAIKQFLKGKMKLVPYTNQWIYRDALFIQQFDLLPVLTQVNKGVKLQQVLAKEFCSMGEEAENLWHYCYEDHYLQQLIERGTRCIKKGTACNEAGEVVQASLFADVGWAILDHVKATGEGMYHGVVKTVDAFLHPISLNKNGGTNQFIYSLGQMTLDVIDFYMLAIKNPTTAQKKLHVWQQTFAALLYKIQQDWQIKTSQDVTKFIAAFAAERVATYGIYQMLGKIFLVARANAMKLAQKKEFMEAVQQQVPKEVDAHCTESVQDNPHCFINDVMRHKIIVGVF